MPLDIEDPFYKRFLPNEAAFKGAKPYASSRKWEDLGMVDSWIWGRCQSKGATQFTSILDMSDGRCYCNCAVRPLPCSHIRGLYILHSEQVQQFQLMDMPDEWKELRPKMVTPEASSSLYLAGKAAPERAILKDKQVEKRQSTMLEGLETVDQLLKQLVYQGMVNHDQTSKENLEVAASRMVDAKLGAWAKEVRLFAQKKQDLSIQAQQIARWQSLYEGMLRMDILPEKLQNDLWVLAGKTMRKEEALQTTPVDDQWLVCSEEEGEEEQLRFRKIWMQGQQSKRFGWFIEYVFGKEPFQSEGWRTGTGIKGAAYFYPQAVPYRLLFPSVELWTPSQLQIPGFTTHPSMAQAYAKHLVLHPLLQAFPVWMHEMQVAQWNQSWWLVDAAHKGIPLSAHQGAVWNLLAMASSGPLRVFGTWDGWVFQPLSYVYQNGVRSL